VSENGYATNLGRDEASQVTDLQSTVEALAKWSGELGISDFRYFNLRDNDSDGSDLFAAVGLLRDDYTPKPAFDVLRGAVAAVGADAGSPAPAAGPPRQPTAGLSVRVVRRARGVIVVSGRVLGAPCRGTVRVRIGRHSRRPRITPACVFRTRARVRSRRTRVTATFGTVRVTRRV
jgi:hypothetical protein